MPSRGWNEAIPGEPRKGSKVKTQEEAHEEKIAMSLYRPKGTKVWVMDFMFHGQRIRETTRMTSITRAREVEDKRKQGLRDGSAGIRKTEAPRLLCVAAAEWQEMKRPKWSLKMS